jgi:hypothetical protein
MVKSVTHFDNFIKWTFLVVNTQCSVFISRSEDGVTRTCSARAVWALRDHAHRW